MCTELQINWFELPLVCLKHCTDISRRVVLKAWECGSHLSTLSSHVARVSIRGTIFRRHRHSTYNDSWTVWCSVSEKWSKVRYFCAVCMILCIDQLCKDFNWLHSMLHVSNDAWDVSQEGCILITVSAAISSEYVNHS